MIGGELSDSVEQVSSSSDASFLGERGGSYPPLSYVMLIPSRLALFILSRFVPSRLVSSHPFKFFQQPVSSRRVLSFRPFSALKKCLARHAVARGGGGNPGKPGDGDRPHRASSFGRRSWSQMLEQMQHVHRLAPNRHCFSAVIKALANGGQWERALQRLDEMRGLAMAPDHIVYASAIGACEKVAKFVRTSNNYCGPRLTQKNVLLCLFCFVLGF